MKKNKRTGIFVSPDERRTVLAAYNASGMFLPGGNPIGDPQREVDHLVKKYAMPGCALDLNTGEFIRVGRD